MSHNPLDAARDEGFIAGASSIYSETLRDRLAMSAFSAFGGAFVTSGWHNPNDYQIECMVRASYRWADIALKVRDDAMMEARK